jgi:hypothetical protein
MRRILFLRWFVIFFGGVWKPIRWSDIYIYMKQIWKQNKTFGSEKQTKQFKTTKKFIKKTDTNTQNYKLLKSPPKWCTTLNLLNIKDKLHQLSYKWWMVTYKNTQKLKTKNIGKHNSQIYKQWVSKQLFTLIFHDLKDWWIGWYLLPDCWVCTIWSGCILFQFTTWQYNNKANWQISKPFISIDALSIQLRSFVELRWNQIKIQLKKCGQQFNER